MRSGRAVRQSKRRRRFGRWLFRNAIWSARMFRLDRIRCSIQLGLYGTASNGIDKTGQHADGGERQENEGIEHKIQEVQGAFWRGVGSSAMRRS